MAKPKLFIFGDSHTYALKAGCEALNIPFVHLGFSGDVWHRLVRPTARGGIVAKGRPRIAQQAAQAAKNLGVKSILDPGVPVVASIGYHFGRLLPPLEWHGHDVAEPDVDFPDDRLFMSRAFLEETIAEKRANHFRILRALARNAPTVLVRPPFVTDSPLHRASYDIVDERIADFGLTVFDHKPHFAQSDQGFVPRDLLEEDGVHGNADYGRQTIEKLQELKLLEI